MCARSWWGWWPPVDDAQPDLLDREPHQGAVRGPEAVVAGRIYLPITTGARGDFRYEIGFVAHVRFMGK